MCYFKNIGVKAPFTFPCVCVCGAPIYCTLFKHSVGLVWQFARKYVFPRNVRRFNSYPGNVENMGSS